MAFSATAVGPKDIEITLVDDYHFVGFDEQMKKTVERLGR
jgi:hypothetical protein